MSKATGIIEGLNNVKPIDEAMKSDVIIIDGDPDAAKETSDEHISYVERTLQDMNIHRRREARAHRRATGLNLS